MKNSINCRHLNKSGIATRQDIENEEHGALLQFLRGEQNLFLEKESDFRSPNYAWPRDALNWWSRIWEYPYVFHHLKKAIETRLPSKPTVVDLGSGVTFFPFSVARLGYEVICMDTDPICGTDLDKAKNSVPYEPGSVSFNKIEGQTYDLEDASIDALYCISVLEHIPDFESTISEIHRVLKPNGLFILTIDLDLSGYQDISIERYSDLRKYLIKHFIVVEDEVSAHPNDILVRDSGASFWFSTFFKFKQIIRFLIGKEFRKKRPNLAVWGAVLRKK